MAHDKPATLPSPPPRRHRRVSLSLDRSGGANPADAAGANINTIVAQYRQHGTFPNIQLSNPLYGDHTGPQHLHETRLAIQQADERFNLLPAAIRSLADNSPEIFLDMLEDPDQLAQLEAAGLITDPDTPEHTPSSPVSPSLPPSPSSEEPPTEEPS